MRTSELLRTIVGSFTVYVVVASCSPSSGTPYSGAGTGGAGTYSGAGSPAVDGGTSGTSAAVASAGASTGNGGAEGASGAAATGGSRASGGSKPTGGATAIAATGGTSIVDPVPTASADPINGTRLKAKYREGADGSKEFLTYQWWDSGRNEDCTFTATADGSTRCLPQAAGSASAYYADSTCSGELALVTLATCSTLTSRYVTKFDSTSGCSLARIFGLGARYTGTVYSKSGTSCAEVSASTMTAFAAYGFYPVGTEIPLSSFVAGTVKNST